VVYEALTLFSNGTDLSVFVQASLLSPLLGCVVIGHTYILLGWMALSDPPC
jgi:hypothetical protein